MRSCLPLLCIGVAVSCSNEERSITDLEPGSISLSISQSNGTNQQGTNRGVMATVIRAGSFTGDVSLNISGLPPGVRSSVSYAATVRGVTTALVSIIVGATTEPGVYTLEVRANGIGVNDVAVPFSLTVTVSPPPPPTPSYTMTLSSPAITIAQGGYAIIPLSLIRSNFTGNVTLSVENLPNGVFAIIGSANPTSGNSSMVYLVPSPNATLGTFSTLLVRGVASGLADRTAPITLTIREPLFALTLSPATVSIVQGVATATTTVSVVRNNYSGPVSFWLSVGDEEGSPPPGVTVAFAPETTTGNSSLLTLTATIPGTYQLYVSGSTEGFGADALLTLTVTPSATASKKSMGDRCTIVSYAFEDSRKWPRMSCKSS